MKSGKGGFIYQKTLKEKKNRKLEIRNFPLDIQAPNYLNWVYCIVYIGCVILIIGYVEGSVVSPIASHQILYI